MTRFAKQIVIRIEPELLAWLAADAEAHGRTVTQSVRFHLNKTAASGETETP